MMALIKALHIAALVVWCASLLTLPLLLGLHRHIVFAESRAAMQDQYTRFRRLTHLTYTGVATPAAVVAIAAGTVLIFMAQVWSVWLLLKLVLVAGMALGHAWLGHLVVQSYEKEVDWRMPWPALSLLVTLPCMLGVLWLVLTKPDLAATLQQLPVWMREPLAMDLQAQLTALQQWWWSRGQESLP